MVLPRPARQLAALTTVVFTVAAGCALTRSFADGPGASDTAHAVAATAPSPSPSPAHSPAAPTPTAASRDVTRTPSPLARPGVHRVSIGSRSFLLVVPAHVHRPAPFMLMLGGISWSAQLTMDRMRVGDTAAAAGGIVAFPDPVGGVWNAGDCCWGSKAKDARFLRQIHQKVAGVFPLDPARQVVAGFSNGGMMAYRAACDDPSWSAIGVLGATLTGKCVAQHPFSITNVNGMLDTSVAWNGGYSPTGRYSTQPIWRMDQAFARAFGCGASSTTKSGVNTVITYAGCRHGVSVRDIRVPGLHHHFPLKEQDGYDFGPVLWHLVLG